MKKGKVLVTAGSTQVMIDQVRSIGNIFRGRTGTAIASYFARLGHEVTLLTSSPKLSTPMDHLRVDGFSTFNELAMKMEVEVRDGNYDAIIHSAAVSDYWVSGVYRLEPNGGLEPLDSSKKISSTLPRLYLEMTQTPKLVDYVREKWGFDGYLVKFKLEVGIMDEELLAIAKNSRVASHANLMVANCLEWSDSYAYVLGENLEPIKVDRSEIASIVEASFMEGRV